MLMPTLAPGGCAKTARESALKVNSGRQIHRHTGNRTCGSSERVGSDAQPIDLSPCLLLTVELRRQRPVQTRFLRQVWRLSKYHCSVKQQQQQQQKQNTWPYCVRKQRQTALGLYRSNREFKTSVESFLSCADRTVCSNSREVVYFACLSGRSYLSPGKRSVELLRLVFVYRIFLNDNRSTLRKIGI